MKKIRTLIAHNDENITNDIVNSIKDLNYVEIVGTAKNSTETYNKIINLQPEMVFTEFNMDKMSGIEMMKLSKKKLDNNMPTFNIITNNITDKELEEATYIIGKKLNALLTEISKNRIMSIMEDYKEHKDKKIVI